jgi:hypothetical protein
MDTNNTNKTNNGPKKDIGGLWLRKSQAGVSYFSGSITINGGKQDIVIFKNTYKKPEEKTPDYKIYLSEAPKQQNPTEKNSSAKPEAELKDLSVETIEEDEIPF